MKEPFTFVGKGPWDWFHVLFTYIFYANFDQGKIFVQGSGLLIVHSMLMLIMLNLQGLISAKLMDRKLIEVSKKSPLIFYMRW